MMVLPEAKIRSRGQGSSGSIGGILVIGFVEEPVRKFWIGFSGEGPLDWQGSLCQTPILTRLLVWFAVNSSGTSTSNHPKYETQIKQLRSSLLYT